MRCRTVAVAGLLVAGVTWLGWSSWGEPRSMLPEPKSGSESEPEDARISMAQATAMVDTYAQRGTWEAPSGRPVLAPGYGGLRIVTVDPAGRPVGGVDVQVSAAARTWLAVTGADGTADFAALPTGLALLAGSDRGVSRTVVLAADRRQTMRLEVSAPRDLTVRVVDRDSEPIAGAAVWMGTRPVSLRGFADDGLRVRIGTTDREGRVLFRSVPDGVRLEAWRPGAQAMGLAQRDLASVPSGASAVTLQLRVPQLREGESHRPGSRLALRVVDEARRPIAGAFVELVGLSGLPLQWRDAAPSGRLSARTGRDGEVVWDHLRDQQVAVRASAPGRQSVTRAVFGFPHRDEIRLCPVVPVHVSVSSQGRPVAFAKLTVQGAPVVYTDPRGTAVVRAPVGRRLVRVVRAGLGEDESEVLVETGTRCECHLTIAPGQQLSGRLRDQSGRELAGWLVQMRESVSVTDASGRFVLGNVPDGVHALSITGAAGSAMTMGSPRERHSGPDFVRFVDTETGSVELKVCTGRGTLVGSLRTKGASSADRPWLEYESEDGARGLVRVGADGRFTCTGLPIGRYWIATTVSEARPPVTRRFGPFDVRAGQECRVGSVAIEGVVSVRVIVDSSEFGPTSLRVWIADRDGRPVQTMGLANREAGTQGVDLRLPPGRYSMGLVGNGVDCTGRSVAVAAAPSQVVRFVAQRAVNLPVRIDLPWGARRVVTVRAFDLRGARALVDSWSDTDFIERSIGLAPGAYRLVATWQNRRAERVVNVRAADPSPVRLRLDR